MNLLVIANHNFTQHIKVPSWKVNKEPKYEEWTDANYLTHREITRYQVNGTFTLVYDDISDFWEFFDLVESIKASNPLGVVAMRVYLNNTGTTETINAFITYTLPNEKPHMNIGQLAEFEVTIKEQ